MGTKKCKKRLSRRARREYREIQENRQATTKKHRVLTDWRKQITRRIEDEKLSHKVCAKDRADISRHVLGILSRDVSLRYRSLTQEVWLKRPGLLDAHYGRGLAALSLVNHSGTHAEWEPKGRGLTAAFRSLVTHVFGGYAANGNLIDCLLVDYCLLKDALANVRIVKAVVSGTKVKSLVGTSVLPAPLTRRMCHLMVNPDRPLTVIESVRRAQVLAHGGNEALARAAGAGMLGSFKSVQLECFWDEVIHWFCRQPDLRPDQVSPLCDYIRHCRGQDTAFTLKGRTLATVSRDMNRWHQELNNLSRFTSKADFQLSGFAAALWEKTRMVGGTKVPHETWAMREIRNPKQLVTEGTAMHHCVAGYHSAIMSGKSSIWSLTMNDGRRLTLEVNNRKKEVVQIRGKYNRLPKGREQAFIRGWARKNGFAITAFEM